MNKIMTTPAHRVEQLGAAMGGKLLADLKSANNQIHAAAMLADALLYLLELHQPEHAAQGFGVALMPVIGEGLGLGLSMPMEGEQP